MATPGKAIPDEPEETDEQRAAEEAQTEEDEGTADVEGRVESGPNPPDDRGL